ncbi:hypothetical protein ACJX0J_041370 [Zea mays]
MMHAWIINFINIAVKPNMYSIFQDKLRKLRIMHTPYLLMYHYRAQCLINAHLVGKKRAYPVGTLQKNRWNKSVRPLAKQELKDGLRTHMGGRCLMLRFFARLEVKG